MRANLNAVVPQDFLYCFIRQMGVIVFLAEVPQKNIFHLSRHHLCQKPSCRMVGKMSVFAQNPLLQRPWITALFQHFHIMICL